MARTKYTLIARLADDKSRKRARQAVRKGLPETAAVRQEAQKLAKRALRREIGAGEFVIDYSAPDFSARLALLEQVVANVESAVFR